ncbi:sugar phosphate nucleotidyltransferase [Flammeovirgaceae bacterium SG7u.111]|nr:sugar phosphate nucleotidyltransferase [Flammeovirgaceae bacterium SG7u.132]WPO35799.1 sugar phosphate nucleotidyltransferase [Flammeovirgaceae bacterium SG7u.111]
MKAIIPVAGIGVTLRPHTHTQPKALVSVAGKPLLSHIVDFLASADIKEFVFIIGYMGNKIESFMRSHYSHNDYKMDFVQQEPRLGSAHAVYCARQFMQPNDELLIMLGDILVGMDLKAMVNRSETVVGVKKVKRPIDFGIAELGSNGEVVKLIEKPKIPKSNLGLVGIYKIRRAADLIQSIEGQLESAPPTKQDFNLTDALMEMVVQGEKVTVIEVDNWYDCGSKESLLEANAKLLKRKGGKADKSIRTSSGIIIPPVKIGRNCDIRNSIIGPNVVVGDHTAIVNSVVSDSIIGSYSILEFLMLNNSIIGNDTKLKGMTQSLNIGDNTEINFFGDR